MRSRGFTVVELVTVILLLSVLSVVGISRMMSSTAFAPAIVSQALVAQVRQAQQLAAARHDAAVTLLVDRSGPDWRFRLLTDVDGIVRTAQVPAEDTGLQAASGTASGAVDASTVLTVRFAASGSLSGVALGAAAGDPLRGVDLTITGDSVRRACIHPSGYVNDDICV